MGVKIFNDISLPAPKIITLANCKVCAEGVPDLALPLLSPIGVGGRVLHIYVPSLWLHLLQGVGGCGGLVRGIPNKFLQLLP